MDIRIGLDFGTHQTKACLNYQKENQPQVREFVLFNSEDQSSFFLPSSVCLMEDQTLRFGKKNQKPAQKEYKYFKIASAEDIAFRGVTGLSKKQRKYQQGQFDGITPEVLSIFYLAWVIGFIKEQCEKKFAIIQKRQSRGLLARFLGNKSQQRRNIDYYLQMGIPTEWSEKRNLWRRRKFEQILYLAHDLLESIDSFEQLEEIPFSSLKERLQELYKNLEKEKKSNGWRYLIRKYNLSVFPETAAGLTCLVKEKKLKPKYYSALDIGGGSSDISYFRVTDKRKIEYLASESLLIASNDLFNLYSFFNETSPSSTEEAQLYLEHIQKNTPSKLDNDNYYREAFEQTFIDLNERYKKIYNVRVYQRFKKGIANKKFEDHDCYVYGGGSLIHRPSYNPHSIFDQILIHDNGTPDSLTATRTYAQVRMLGKITLPFEVKPATWRKYRALLLVPLGLSNIQPDQSYDWSDRHYKPGKQITELDLQEPSLFNIFGRRWI
jgi:hypothetical protein